VVSMASVSERNPTPRLDSAVTVSIKARASERYGVLS
jgi:hypothetical protein